MADKGWVKIHRKMLDNPIVCKDSDHLSIWMYLLLNATHDDYDIVYEGKRMALKPGQLITGRKSISEKLLINESKVQRVLKTLEIEQQIEQQTNPRNRLITIVRWCEYQESEQQNEQQVNNKRTTSEHIQEHKNIRTKEKERDIAEKLVVPLKDFSDMRKKIKAPLTDKAVDMLLKKLDTLSGGNIDKQVEILNQSTLNSWKSVYELKEKPKEERVNLW